MRLFIVAFLIFSGAGCSKGGGGSSVAAISNAFTEAGFPLTIDRITGGSAVLSTETYHGRILFKSGGQVYGGSFHFDLIKNDDSTAYFSGFTLDRLVLFLGMTSVVPVVTTPIDLSVPGSYSSGSNALSLVDSAARHVGINLDFGNNAAITTDLVSGAAIFTSNFSTLVGGDASTFFFIAQKASSLPSVTSGDLERTWVMIDFSVTGLGQFTLRDFSKVQVGGTGGMGHIIFQGLNVFTNVLKYAGEYILSDSGAGAFGVSYDVDPAVGSPITGSGSVDGAFLLSPGKQYILGFDVRTNSYFAGSY